MVRIIVQVRELVSSNVSALAESAASPAKMLRLLRKEIEEADIALHGELAKLRRQADRAAAEAKTLDARADDWSEKARIAMQKGREDLARAALMAREDGKLLTTQKLQHAADLKAEIAEAEEALDQLQKKLAETNKQLKAADSTSSGTANATGLAVAESRTNRRLDHISALERRVGFTLDDAPAKAALSEADIEAEITAIQRDDQIDAQLAILKAESGKPAKRKAPARKKAG